MQTTLHIQPVRAELVYPSRMNHIPALNQRDIMDATPIHPLVEEVKEEKGHKKLPFIEANTKEVSLEHLKKECIVPVFSKDNEVTISHPNFIEAVWEAAHKAFPGKASAILKSG